MPTDDSTRHSKALEAEIVSDPDEVAKIEARNGVRQFDAVADMIENYSDAERKFKLRPSHLLTLQRIALEGLSSYAGNFRPAGIEIGGSRHQPPAHTWCRKKSSTCAITSTTTGEAVRRFIWLPMHFGS